MKDFKIGIYMPVGPIYRLSYQYFIKTVLQNYSKYFHQIVLVSNSRETKSIPIDASNISLISDDRTWFEIVDGIEKFDFELAAPNQKIGFEELERHKVDIIIIGDILMYIRDDQISKLIDYCKNLIYNNVLSGYRYRSLVIRDKFAVPNIKHPWVINTSHEDYSKLKVRPDEIDVDGKIFRAERGIYEDAPYFFCDLFPPILTKKDYNEKYEYYIKHLNEYYNNKNQDEDWFNYIRGEYNKYKSTPLMNDVDLDEWGKKMIQNIPDHSIYDYFDLLEGNTFDRLKFKLLEYKYRLSV